MENTAYEFWKRVDSLRGKRTITDIAVRTGVKEQRLMHLRSDNRYPKIEDCILIARDLNTSIDYLVFGSALSNQSNEARYVDSSPEAQVLVRALMRDPALLQALSAVIESTEKKLSV